MCRLLAYVAPAPTRMSEVIGEGQCERFERMGRLHDDGWGSMWIDETGARPRLVRERDAASAFGDVRLAHALREPPARARTFHLRLATGDLPVRLENTHPFVVDGIGLAHNGSLLPTSLVRDLLEPQFAAAVQGDTDSELYLALVRQHAASAPSLPDAVRSAVATLRALYPTASLNAVVMDARQMIVVHASTTAAVPYEHFDASGLGPGELPADHDERYYRIGMLRTAQGALAFSSSGLDRSGWLVLPDETVTVVDVATTELHVQPLPDFTVSAPAGRLSGWRPAGPATVGAGTIGRRVIDRQPIDLETAAPERAGQGRRA